jgi:hypothetical protein
MIAHSACFDHSQHNMRLTAYAIKRIFVAMWEVVLADEFVPEVAALDPLVRRELLAQAGIIRAFGPLAKRPRVDTLNGSKHANMKELRFAAAGGEWRAAFAFDPKRRAVLLVAGDKSGLGPSKAQKKFYDDLIDKADARFDGHLARMRK